MKARTIIALAAVNGLVATAASALGAHALAGIIAQADMALFEKAATFQFYHAFALIAAAFGADRFGGKLPSFAASAFMGGIIAFSGSLYWRAVLGAGSLGSFHWITPVGGLCMMAGWGMLAVAALKPKPD